MIANACIKALKTLTFLTDSKHEFVKYGKQGSVTENAVLRVYNLLTNILFNIENSNLHTA